MVEGSSGATLSRGPARCLPWATRASSRAWQVGAVSIRYVVRTT